jgi:flagellar hook-associated protein 1 FlgK
MPSSTFGSFEAAKSGLSVAMQQLNVTEQNIANVNTPGYSRQRIMTSAKEPAASTYLIAQLNKALVGQGVETTGIQQIRSVYLDKQYRALNANYSYSSSRSNSLEYLTGLFNELNDEGSLTTSIGNFFSSLNTFASDTSSKEFRTNVQQQALSMTQNVNNVYEEMQSLWNDQNDSIATAAQKINAIGEKISKLNDAIARIAQTGSEANDLNDERNLLLDELSGYVNMTYTVNATNDSMVDVSIGGLRLVEGTVTNTITVDTPSAHATEIDALTNQIGSINAQVVAGTMTPGAAATAIDDILNGTTTPPGLLSYLPVTTSANASNPSLIDVKLGNAFLVKGTTATPAETAVKNDLTAWVTYNKNNLTLDGNPLSIDSGTVTGGSLFSHMEMVTSQSAVSPGIPFYMDQINSLVREMAENLNNITRSGWTYPDGTSPSVTGINLFKVPSQVVAGVTVYDYSAINGGNFTLSDEVLLSAYNIAGSSQQVILNSPSTESGNNIIARELANNLTVGGYYDKLNSIVGNLAIAANTSDSIMSTKESLIESIDTQRQSVSAVSLDEETTNLIIFQQSYQACARVITALDEMLEAMINKMGITGR